MGPEHPKVIANLNNLAQTLLNLDRQAEAEPLLRRVLALDEKALGLDDPEVASDLSTLGLNLVEAERLDEAEPLLQKSLSILTAYRKRTGKENPDEQDLVLLITSLWESQGLSKAKIAKRLRDLGARPALVPEPPG